MTLATAELHLFPISEPYDQALLPVSDIHSIWYTQSGNPQGKPVIYLHGGPGSSTSPGDTVWFDPAIYRIILLDQRGCGKSIPHAEVKENTTWDLVKDIEKLRKHLSIDKWVLFGGSWGSTLSLAYAQTFPHSCKALILRGIFLFRQMELDWQSPSGVGMLWPEEWEEYVNFLPEDERHDIPGSYARRILSDDPTINRPACRAHNLFEGGIGRLIPDPERFDKVQDDNWNLSHARMECHYFMNKGWLREGQLLEKANIDRIRHIPCTLVQGRYDTVCPPKTAYDLHKAWPESKLYYVPDAGHSAKEPGMIPILLAAAKEYSAL